MRSERVIRSREVEAGDGSGRSTRLARAALLLGSILLPSYPPALSAQWNSPESLALVQRAVDRRLVVQADSTLTSYRAKAQIAGQVALYNRCQDIAEVTNR